MSYGYTTSSLKQNKLAKTESIFSIIKEEENPSAGKVISTIFWNINFITFTDYQQKEPLEQQNKVSEGESDANP
jgi:hypothetical protein